MIGLALKILICLVFLFFFLNEPVRNGKRARDAVWTSFWRQKVPHAGNLPPEIMDCVVPLLLPHVAILHLHNSSSKTARAIRRRVGAVGLGGAVADPFALQLRVRISAAEVLAVPAPEPDHCMGFPNGAGAKCLDKLAVGLCF